MDNRTPDDFLRRVSFWKLNLVVWTLFAIFSLLERLLLLPTLMQTLIFSVLQIPLAVLISGGMRQIFLTSIGTPFRVKTAAWVILLGLIAAIVHAFVMHHAAATLGWISPSFHEDTAFAIRIKFYWLVYMGWGLGYFGVRAHLAASTQAERARKAGEEARRIELQMLRAQLDPHFLFNTLNSVTAEIRPHPDAALQMMRELCDYLRYSLQHRDEPTGALSSELDAVSAYLEIQQARFGDRLRTRINADEASRQQIVPSFLLQPLVENAVKHGFETGQKIWELELTASLNGDTLTIEVKNSGHLNSEASDRIGVGLSTLERRLDLHYPRRHTFTLTEDGDFVCAKLILIGSPCCV